MTGGVLALMLGGRGTSDPPVRSRAGLVRIERRSFLDDGGEFFPIGATLFWALHGWANDRERLLKNLAFLSGKVDYVRILCQVDWSDRHIVIGPNQPGWDPAGFIETAYRQFGLRTELTIIGGGGSFNPMSLAGAVLEATRGREAMIMHVEMANELNSDPATVLAMGRLFRDRSALIRAPFSPTGGDLTQLKPLMSTGIFNLATVHTARDEGDDDWRFVRQVHEYIRESSAFSSNEPKGPRSSIAQTTSPVRLAAARAVGIIQGVAAYVLHNGAGVTGLVDPPHDRPANLFEVPGIDDVMRAVRGVDELLPGSVRLADWEKHNQSGPNGDPGHPLVADAIWSDGNDHGVSRNYAAVNGGRFVVLPYGIKKFVDLVATSDCQVVASDIVTHKRQEATLRRGERLRLDGDAVGTNRAYIVEGQR